MIIDAEFLGCLQGISKVAGLGYWFGPELRERVLVLRKLSDLVSFISLRHYLFKD